jgi:hypothetical protein
MYELAAAAIVLIVGQGMRLLCRLCNRSRAVPVKMVDEWKDL